MTKVTFQFVLGILLLIASNPVFAKMDGNKLFQQFSSEIRQYERANHLPDLLATIRKTIPSAKLRSSKFYEYTITTFPDMFYDVTGLKKGQHPSHTTGDWDCDSEKDQAVIVQKPKVQVVVVLSSGMTLTFDKGVDQITASPPGRYGIYEANGGFEGKKTFTAKCGFINAMYWGKSSFALVVDLKAQKLVQYWLSD